ncbi:tetratricopeptide repeat protein [Pseudoalteromonas sp. SSDWG2]|uniref:tetratricopeptide repeat protein n=1 Tax=Pseudoalteromonas sp. SSDWG2 TaxID=3139391 RepID=UPI003BAA30F5
MNRLIKTVMFALAMGLAFGSSLVHATLPDEQKQELDMLGTEFAAAIRHMNMGAMASLYDTEGTAHIIAKHLFTSARERREFVKGFVSNPKEQFLSNLFAFQHSEDTDAVFLRIIETDGERTPVIRLDMEGGGHDFMHLFVHQTDDGQLQVYDVFVASTGKRITDKVSENMSFILGNNSNVLQRLLGIKKLDESIVNAYTSMIAHVKAGEGQAAWHIYQQLPENVRLSRGMLDISMGVAQLVSEEAYYQQLELLATHFGDDPSTEFMLIDYYFGRNEFEKTLNNINNLQQRYGEEAALYNLKANVYFAAGQLEQAEKMAKRSQALEPFFMEAYWTEFAILNQLSKYEAMIGVLNNMVEMWDFSFTAQDFEAEPSFAEFVQSQQFKSWIKTQG